jgi:hypothetical protein
MLFSVDILLLQYAHHGAFKSNSLLGKLLTIFGRAVVQPLVSGYSGNKYKGFRTLDEAIQFMEATGHLNSLGFPGK